MKFVDPDGRRVKIGSWYGRILVKLGFDTYEKRVENDIQKLKGISPLIKNTIEAIEGSKHVIFILHPSERPDNDKIHNGFLADREKNADENIKSGGRLYYDPSNNITAQKEKREPIIGLIHELGHGENAINGTYTPIKRNNLNEQVNIEKNEKRSIELENIVREYFNRPIRSKYFDTK